MWKSMSFAALLCLSPSSFAALTDQNPTAVCAWLDGSGLIGREWSNSEDGTSGCSSDYKEIGEGSPLPNNLAFYAEGVSETVNEVRLVVNYNQPRSSKSATRELVAASEILAKQALGLPLPKRVVEAISAGKPIIASVGSGSVEVSRMSWPTGRGYEVHVLMK